MKSFSSEKAKRLSECLSRPIIDINELKQCCWTGVPSHQRPLTWKLLLNYAPMNKSRRSLTIQRRRREYHYQHLPFSSSQCAANSSPQHANLHKQIRLDIERTAPHIPLFRQQRIKSSLIRILYAHACRNPAASYVQGMNDLILPIFAVLLSEYLPSNSCDRYESIDIQGLIQDGADTIPNETLNQVEADTYFCFTNFMAGMQDHFLTDQPRIQHMVHLLQDYLERVDVELYQHLVKTCELDMFHFSFRWMNCILVRELSFSCSLRIFDTYLCEWGEKLEWDTLHVYVCVAFLRSLKSKIIGKMGDEILEFLTVGISEYSRQNILIHDVEMWLGQAHVWRSDNVANHTFDIFPEVTRHHGLDDTGRSFLRSLGDIIWGNDEHVEDNFCIKNEVSTNDTNLFDCRV